MVVKHFLSIQRSNMPCLGLFGCLLLYRVAGKQRGCCFGCVYQLLAWQHYFAVELVMLTLTQCTVPFALYRCGRRLPRAAAPWCTLPATVRAAVLPLRAGTSKCGCLNKLVLWGTSLNVGVLAAYMLTFKRLLADCMLCWLPHHAMVGMVG